MHQYVAIWLQLVVWERSKPHISPLVELVTLPINSVHDDNVYIHMKKGVSEMAKQKKTTIVPETKNKVTLADLRKAMDGEIPGVVPTLEADVQASPLDGMWDKINAAEKEASKEAVAFALEVKKRIESRANAYIAYRLINDALHVIGNDVTHPFYQLQNAHFELSRKLSVVEMSGGVRIGKVPVHSPIREELKELERKINKIKNAVAEVIASEYGVTPDEAFSLVREERALYEQQNKEFAANGQKPK